MDYANPSNATLLHHCLTEKTATTNGINVKQAILQCERLVFLAIFVILNMLSKTEHAFHKFAPEINRNSMELIVYSLLKVVQLAIKKTQRIVHYVMNVLKAFKNSRGVCVENNAQDLHQNLMEPVVFNHLSHVL
jgi:hypothetical protein